jgi:hemoglobin/transferrin/lactoferrin receptor protein
LLVVDGIRFNNAIYRSGHLQNVISLDQNMLERVEVLYGPASTIYGSDALGGVIHVRTKSPKFSTNDKVLPGGSSFLRYSFANLEKTGHVDLSLGWKKIAWLQSYTFSDFGDMKMGRNYPDKYPTFGRRDSLIAFFGFKDSVIANPDNRAQRFSDYMQWDYLQKLLIKQTENITHQLSFQFSNTNNVPRYDRLQDKRDFGGTIGKTLRYAEWYYGPQERFLYSYEFNADKAGFLDAVKANISLQHVKESRQQREYRRYDRFDSRKERVNVWFFVADGRKFFGNNELTFGADAQLNDVQSTATRLNLLTGAVSKLDSRYPDGENQVNYFGLYAQHILKSKSRKWVLNDGIRLQKVKLNSNVVDNSFFNLPVTKYEQDNFAVTGNLGLIYLPTSNTRAAINLSSGFRSPNIDDLVKIFDFSVAKRVYVPNAEINPEYTYNADLTVSHLFAERVRLELNGFYTLFDNAIASAPFKLNGQDSIVYNGVTSAVYANQNVNKANLYGFIANVNINIMTGFALFSTATYTHGRLKKFDKTAVPMDHIPPFFGKTSLNYQHERFSGEFYALYNGWKKIADYNPDGEDNQQYATPDGMPSWMTINFKGSITLAKGLQLQAGVENIADRNYRYFGSGFSASGRNFFLSARFNW